MFSILFGAFFPAFKEASASFLSFLGDQVYAQSVPAQISPISNDSDKYLPPPSSLKVFNNIKQTNTTDDTIADNTDINTNNTALSVITGPL